MSLSKPVRTAGLSALGVVGAAVAVVLGWRYIQAEHERKLAALPLKERGAALLQDSGCNDCHQPGSAFRAPILTGLFGKQVKLQDGSEVIADEAYIRRSLIDPEAQVVQGYQPVMPSYDRRLSVDAMTALIEAMK